MEACGCTRAQAKTIAVMCFQNQYTTIRSERQLRDVFKNLSEQPANKRVRLMPDVQMNIYGYNAWMKHQARLGNDPSMVEFDPDDTNEMLEIDQRVSYFIENKLPPAEPAKFTNDVSWDDWKPTVVHYLSKKPGSNGIPLSYVIRDNPEPDTDTQHKYFMDDYVSRAPLSGTSFESDSSTVQGILRNLIMGNTEAEAAIRPFESQRSGRIDWTILKQHYEGKGIFAKDLTEAVDTLYNLDYTDEKPPQKTWTKFITKLNWAFSVYDKRFGRGRPYFHDDLKLIHLFKNVKANFLNGCKTNMKNQLNNYSLDPSATPITYQQACLNFQTVVQDKFPSESGSNPRRIKQTKSKKKKRNNNSNKSTVDFDAKEWNSTHKEGDMIRLKNGDSVRYHAKYKFPKDVYIHLVPDEIKQRMKKERDAYHGNNKRSVAQTDSQSVMQSQINELYLVLRNSSGISQVSEITTNNNTVGFGGRTEQQQFKRQRQN